MRWQPNKLPSIAIVTLKRKREILRLQGRFYGIMAKKMENAMQGALDELDSWAEEADCFSEGFDEGYDE